MPRPPVTDPAPPPAPLLTRLWRRALPIAVAVIAAALALGVLDTTARPAWLFLVGAVIGVVGAASLVAHLVMRGREGLAAIERRIEDELEETRRP